MQNTQTHLTKDVDFWRGSFAAMASPCEILMEVDDKALAEQILQIVSTEAFRIERQFSRYRGDNIVYQINHARGEPLQLDAETARLIDFADQLYQMSDGMFDITSGVLREVWHFDGSDKVPKQADIDPILDRIGWYKVNWQSPELTLPVGMEIDLGGIGKEYAVDRSVQLVQQISDASVLINFGGDLAVTAPRQHHPAWSVGRLITGEEQQLALFQLKQGAIATSGDAHRYLLKDGIRYSHVLNPKTGWPVTAAPHTVSIAAPTCLQAGMMSTLAMLHGSQAEAFLKIQEVPYWLD